MFRRKSTPPTVSPLAPPPASTQQQQYQQHPQHHRGPPPPQQQQHNRPSSRSMGPPASSPEDLSRVSTSGSMNSKSEKRRSGFFGFGGKKDKEKDREDKHERPAGRSSFSIDRNASHQHNAQPIPRQKQGHPEPSFIPPDTGDRYPRPQSSHTPPLGSYDQNGPQRNSSSLSYPGGPGSPPPHLTPPNVGGHGQQRIVSSPQPRPSNELGPSSANPQDMPKSQSMGFAQRQNVPETHPYRGYLNSQQEKGQMSPGPGEQAPQRGHGGQGGQVGGNMPRSSMSPLNQLNDNSPVRSPPLVEKETMSGSPSLSHIGEGIGGVGAPNQPWMKQFETIVDLIAAQPQKTYVASPPELEMILARTSAGGQPKQGQPGSAANDWDSVWLQLSGISLSMWSMKETRAAAAKGEKVPPTYFNITDSSLELLAPLPPPPHRPTSHPHHFVFSLNTAGSNRLLFSCPSEHDIAKWSTGLRLAAWERARLEEIYTGHLIKAGGREPKSAVQRGRMEGWVRVRVMGGTDWKRLWAVLHIPNAPEEKEDDKKNKRRSIFGFGEKEKEVVQEPNTGISMASFYTEPRTVKNKTIPAALTITAVTQAYAVFPERLEVMSQSNLLKVVGKIGGDLVTIEGRMRDSGWALIMPETPEAGTPPPPTPLVNMMKWVTGFHDVFAMYGRPERYNWNPYDPQSLFFAYPQGPNRNRLFLDLEDALQSDFRLSNLPAIRAQFCQVVQRRIAKPVEQYQGEEEQDADGQQVPRREGSYRLPPLQYGDSSPAHSHDSQPRSLTPITERTDVASRTNSTRTAGSTFFMGERKVSDGPPAKQSSQGSNKHHPGGTGDDRLAPISDSTETFGQYIDEPVSHNQGVTSHPDGPDSAPSPSSWSQASEDTPKLAEGNQFDTPLPALQTGVEGRGADDTRHTHDRDLLDMPHTNRTNSSSSAQAAPVASIAPPLPPVAVSAGDRDQVVHAPQPKRGSHDPDVAHGASPLRNEPAAMYLMNMVDEPSAMTPRQAQPQQPVQQVTDQSRPVQAPISPPKALSPPLSHDANSPATPDISHLAISTGPKPVTSSPERPRIITNFDGPRSHQDSLGRKPSGARAPPPKKTSAGSRLDSISDTPSEQNEPVVSKGSQATAATTDLGSPVAVPSGETASRAQLPSSATQADLGEDVAHFISYADAPSPQKKSLPAIQQVSPPTKPEEELRSSFTPSRAAEERRAKAEQAVKDQQRAMNVPGGGKRTPSGMPARPQGGTWSDEEDEDEDEKEDEASPEIIKRSLPQQGETRVHPPQRGMSQTRALPPVPRPNGEINHERGPSYGPRDHSRPRESAQNQQERPREASMYSAGPGVPSEHPRSYSPAAPHRNQPAQAAPQPPSARQTLWNANFSAEHGMDQPKSGKFVDLDEPSAQLTKAFAPHGLLQAGMQDKEDRSAKKQEELAREMGSSLINVPSKPPPPQTGLLGAVAAHEKDRKNAGGIGATLTDREREKRFAEERQREIEKLQRQQMEHMSRYGGEMPQQGQGGYSQYGGYGMPPMSMMGMPPPMSYNPYQQGAYNPYAQQQAMMAAQMAYQYAMMMSQAGSQAAGPTSPMPGLNGNMSPDRPASPASMQGQGGMGGMAQSPSMSAFSNYFAPPAPNFAQWGGMPGMPWSPSPPPMMGGSGWLQPPSMHGGMGGSQDGGEARGRGHSMYSDGGERDKNQPAN